MGPGLTQDYINFYGSEEIWDGEFIYSTHSEAVNRFQGSGSHAVKPIKPNMLYRQYIEKKYDVKRQLKETDEYLGT